MKSFRVFLVTLFIFLTLGFPRFICNTAASSAATKPAAASAQVSTRGLKPTDDKQQERGLSPTQSERGLNNTPPTAVPSPAGQSYALVIGVSKYPGLPAENQLKYAGADATAIHDFLVSNQGGFRPENVTLLVDENATLAQIKRSIDNLLKQSGRDGVAIIFFAGHGFATNSGLGYLLAYDSKPNDLSVTGLEMELFNTYVQQLRSRGVVIISDACHSGRIGDLPNRTMTSGINNVTAKSFREASRTDQSTFILSAATINQSSYEDDKLGHGIFTYTLLNALKGAADADHNGVVTAAELADYLTTEVRATAEKVGAKQVPETNPFFDRTIPLSILDDRGRGIYSDWIKTNALVARLVAHFDSAINAGHLLQPEDDSAWAYLMELRKYDGTPADVRKEKTVQLAKQLVGKMAAALQAPPAKRDGWVEAKDWSDKLKFLTDDPIWEVWKDYCQGMIHQTSDEPALADKEFQGALATYQEKKLNEPAFGLKIGQFYRSQGAWEKSRVGYRIAVENQPDSAIKVDWLYEYGEALIRSNDITAAQTQLQRAISIAPNRYEPYKLTAELWLSSNQKNKLDDARIAIEKARELSRNSTDVQAVYGKVLLRLGETSHAVEVLREVAQTVISDASQRDEALLSLSKAYVLNNDMPRAISALREATGKNSTRVEIYDELANLLSEQGDPDTAVIIEQKAITLLQNNQAEQAKRLRMMAGFLERAGKLEAAAYKYRDAAKLIPDSKISSALELQARVLFLRIDQAQNAGESPAKPMANTDKPGQATNQRPIVIPGGIDALAYITGVNIKAPNQRNPLAAVLDACLRDDAIYHRVLSFYKLYPELSEKVLRKGGANGQRLELPAPSDRPTDSVKEALKFFGVEDKKGQRVFTQEFETRKFIMAALGADPQKFKDGGNVILKFGNDELPMAFGFDLWKGRIKDGPKAKDEEALYLLLQSRDVMEFYVGLSMLTPEAAKWCFDSLTGKESAGFSEGLYFAAPYLRFTAQGELIIPGQREGERNWERVLKSNPANPIKQLLFKPENGGALYLFTALSAAGDVGDFISKRFFDQFYRKVPQKAQIPKNRAQFDLIDLLSALSIDKEQLHLSPGVEKWLLASSNTADVTSAILAKTGDGSGMQRIVLAQQIGVLSQIEKENPAWLANPRTTDLIAAQVVAGRESQLEVVLDLQFDEVRLSQYLNLVSGLESISSPEAKTNAIRTFQSAFELLRIIARNGAVKSAVVTQVVDQLLKADPTKGEFGIVVLNAFSGNLLGGQTLSGQDFEEKLFAYVGDPPLAFEDNQKAEANQIRKSYYLDAAQLRRERFFGFLSSQNAARLKTVVDTLSALSVLQREPANANALRQLQSWLGDYFEAEAPVVAKKGKSKHPEPQAKTLKEMAAGLSSPTTTSALAEVQARLIPYIGESLLDFVYAANASEVSERPAEFSKKLVRAHNFETTAWGNAEPNQARDGITGSVTRLSGAISELAGSSSSYSNSDGSIAPVGRTLAVVVDSFGLVNKQWVSGRGAAYVSRSIDLGEDVMALARFGDRMAQQSLQGLAKIMSAQRFNSIRQATEQGEIKKAIETIAPSELYYLAQQYIAQRTSNGQTIADLINEPGSLGVLATIINQSNQSVADSEGNLKREVRQFGSLAAGRSGLSRLSLDSPEPYEWTLAFQNTDRLGGRLQDIKLSIARAGYRNGESADLTLSPIFAQELLRNAISQWTTSTHGTLPPGHDWQRIVLSAGGLAEYNQGTFAIKMSGSKYVKPVAQANWNDKLPVDTKK